MLTAASVLIAAFTVTLKIKMTEACGVLTQFNNT